MLDVFFADVPSALKDPNGVAYPKGWTEIVEVTPATEKDPAVTETRLKKEHQDYPWAPPVIGTTEFGHNVYFEIRSTPPDEYKAAGLYLASSYYELANLHPEISRRCAEVEYESEKGVISRCKVHDLPAGKASMGVFAPVKYAGVESPTEPPVGDTAKEIQELKAENVELKKRLDEGKVTPKVEVKV